MKEFIALIAIVLCVLVAYQMHRDRLEVASKANAPIEFAKWPLSEYLEPYRKELMSPLDERRPADLVAALVALRTKVLARQQTQDASVRPISEAGIAALDQMIAAAEQRTRALRELLQISARPTSSLERTDTTNTAVSFFKDSALRRLEAASAPRLVGVKQGIEHLRRAEKAVMETQGVEAAQEDYGVRRMVAQYLSADGKSTGNPLDQGAYDQRRVIVPRVRGNEVGGL